MTVDKTRNVVVLRKYPGIEYGPEVDAALEAVLAAQEALRDAALRAQGQHGFSVCGASSNREAYMNMTKELRRELQEANEHLSALSVRACQKAGCYGRI